uniref:hypothetical protein n=1 Tax=Streptomyces niveiscabiei TaxID=164115 RepID=UPI0038F71334
LLQYQPVLLLDYTLRGWCAKPTLLFILRANKELIMLEIKPIFHALCRSKVGAILLLIQIAITTAIVSNAAFIIQDRIAFLNQETGYPEQ